ncbi:MAG: hypothetical protein GY762_22685 [Proteobacteria bacterium]|nr:hypothetical protein [Pseudomonadota bacterium]
MHLSLSAAMSLTIFLLALPSFSNQPDPPATSPPAAKTQTATPKKPPSKTEKKNKHWRKDPTVVRRPGSYLGGGLAYSQGHTWYVSQHEDATNSRLHIGPAHLSHVFLRVGDAFAEWFALGFQINIASTIGGEERVSVFGMLLDTTFYPWRGLGIRPSVGLGFAYVESKTSSTRVYGYGWPANLSLTFTYEIRVTRHFVIAPFAQVYWITGKDFDGLFYCFGLEFLRWFKTATG